MNTSAHLTIYLDSAFDIIIIFMDGLRPISGDTDSNECNVQSGAPNENIVQNH